MIDPVEAAARDWRLSDEFDALLGLFFGAILDDDFNWHLLEGDLVVFHDPTGRAVVISPDGLACLFSRRGDPSPAPLGRLFDLEDITECVLRVAAVVNCEIRPDFIAGVMEAAGKQEAFH